MFIKFENGICIREIKNNNAKDTILYIHGLGESGLCFEKVISDPKLAGYNHIVIDLPGYGKSYWPQTPMGFPEFISVIAKYIKEKELDPVVILGHSMGGVIGLMLCEKYPELIKAFINVEGNICVDDCVFSGKVASYEIKEFLSSGFDEICDYIYDGGIHDKTFRGYYASLRMCDSRAYHKNSKELVEASKTENLASRLSALKMPTLYIAGDPRGIGDHSKSLLTSAGANWLAIDNSGHWPAADQQEDFVGVVEKFLRNL